MLFFVLAYGAPSSAVAFVIYRLVKTRDLISVSRVDLARAGARLEGAQRAAALSEAGRVDAAGTAQGALEQLGQALAVARGVEQVGEQVQGLADYLVAKIDGPAPQGIAGRHTRPALPSSEQLPAISGGAQGRVSS